MICGFKLVGMSMLYKHKCNGMEFLSKDYFSQFCSMEILQVENWYSTWDQTVHFTYVTSLWVEGKQMHVLSKPKTLSAQEMRQ
jgi:hypothetical protein